MLVFGVAFQTPIAVFILVRTGLVPIQTLRSYRKYVTPWPGLCVCCGHAVAGPVLHAGAADPFYGLYELGILLSVFAEKKAKAKEGQAPASTTSDAKRPAKTRAIKISLMAVFGISILWVVLTLLFPSPPSMPSYAFLKGQMPVAHDRIQVKMWPGVRVWQDSYSFPADFNSVCTDAQAELSGLSFVNRGLRGQGPWTREYELRSPSGDNRVTVRICEDSELIRNSTSPQTVRQAKPGSVIVDVVVTDRDFRLWKDLKSGPAELLHRMGLLRGNREPGTPASQ